MLRKAVGYVSRSKGKRLEKDGRQPGRKDRLQAVWQQTLLWSQLEEATEDVVEDFLDRLEEAIAVREKDLEAGALTAEGRLELSAMQQKLDSMKSNKKQRVKYAHKLVTKCGLTERTCQQTANLPFEEEKARLDTAWRLFDLLLA